MEILKPVIAISMLLSSPIIARQNQQKIEIHNAAEAVDDIIEIIEEIQYEQEEPNTTFGERAKCLPSTKKILKKVVKITAMIAVLIAGIFKK